MKRRQHLDWYEDVPETLDMCVPRDLVSSHYLLDSDGHGRTAARKGLSTEQKEMVLQSYKVGARHIAQQPCGTSVTNLSAVISKLKSTASNINTGARTKPREKAHPKWLAGAEPTSSRQRFWPASSPRSGRC